MGVERNKHVQKKPGKDKRFAAALGTLTQEELLSCVGKPDALLALVSSPEIQERAKAVLEAAEAEDSEPAEETEEATEE